MRLRSTFTLAFSFLCAGLLSGQDYSALKYREAGPYRGGRVTTVAGVATSPGTFYFGATGGGVWKSEDYGARWFNISDGYFKTPSIGAIAVAQNDPNVLYVGTGSDGLRSNVIEGRGMYKSVDAGNSWMEIGLKHVGQIGAVRLHPEDFNTVYVAAIGKAFRSNPERGLFKTSDGGKTWSRVLFISEETGVSDVEMLPTNPNFLFAAAWKAIRTPWTIISGGTAKEGGLYKSLDAGKTWYRVENGLPKELIGKIDIEVSASDSRIVYALVEAPGKEGGLYKSIDQGESFTQVSSHNGIRSRPFYYTNIRVDPKNPDVVYAMATGYYKSEDGGENWNRMNPPHGDNHDMWINPNAPNLFIQSNDGGANVTHNGGKSWSTQFNQPTAEIYQVEVDNQHPYWLYGGQQDNYSTVAVPSMPPYGVQAPGIGFIQNTGGCETGPAVPHPTNPDIVYSNCKGRFTVYNKRTGTEQSYYVGASNMYGHNPRDLKFRFQRVSPIHVSPHDPKVIYHTSQYVHKTTDEGKTWEIISPDLTAFEADKQVISGSPITRDITGEEFYSTIYAIRESPLQAGVIWVGSNDGPIHVTRDGGSTWDEVTPRNLPPGGRVDAVEPSPHNPAKAYVAVLRYLLGDPKPYIYKTENYGKNWTLLTTGSNGIPDDFPTRVIREDPEREGLLFAGTEYGMFVSTNDGETWKSFQQNLPVTPITDLKIHRGDLALSTMGRGFWILDQIGPLRQRDLSALSEPYLFKPERTMRYRTPSGAWNGDTPSYPKAGVVLDYFLPEKGEQPVKIEIRNASGQVLTAFSSDSIPNGNSGVSRDMGTNFTEFLVSESLTKHKGLNRFRWDMTMAGPWNSNDNRKYRNGPMVPPGAYKAVLVYGDKTLSQDFELVMDPRVVEGGVSETDVKQQVEFQRAVRDKLSEAYRFEQALEKEVESLNSKPRLSASEQTRLKTLEGVLSQVQTEEGIYMQPMLADQWRYLYSMMNQADQLPGRDAQQRFSELEAELQRLKSKAVLKE
ncbi:WD40/YVTN/BNR-like repeat-containing protein [Robiginitalea sp.]|uniref:WD40/YVTN/BNR-like repeat-containing protein n=1 Tax=Robiginitalea sp. TaxID=1902411 RepID=UPI003C48391C